MYELGGYNEEENVELCDVIEEGLEEEEEE